MWWMTMVATSAESAALPCGHAICAIAADPESAGFEEEPTRRRDEPHGPIALSIGADAYAPTWQVVADPDLRLIVESRARFGIGGHPEGPHTTSDWAEATATPTGWRLARPTPDPDLEGVEVDGLQIRVRALSADGHLVDDWGVVAEIPQGC